MDTPIYESKVSTKISKLKDDSINENYPLTQTIEKTMEILNDSAKQCSNQRKYGKNKLKLNIWNNDIKVAIKQWKEAGNPKRPEHPLLLRKVETRKIYRIEIRKEESKRKHEERDKIINAQSYNKKIFYQMITKQRNNRNVVEDLYVGNSI